jgi:hypothetical protein
VRRIGPTKAFAAHIWRAPADRTKTDSSASVGRNMIINVLHHLPTSEPDVAATDFFDKFREMTVLSTFNPRISG